jgi:hypothetical protein
LNLKLKILFFRKRIKEMAEVMTKLSIDIKNHKFIVTKLKEIAKEYGVAVGSKDKKDVIEDKLIQFFDDPLAVEEYINQAPQAKKKKSVVKKPVVEEENPSPKKKKASTVKKQPVVEENPHITKIRELLGSNPNPAGPSEEQKTRWVQLQNEVRAAKKEVTLPNDIIQQVEKYMKDVKTPRRPSVRIRFEEETTPVKKKNPSPKKTPVKIKAEPATPINQQISYKKGIMKRVQTFLDRETLWLAFSGVATKTKSDTSSGKDVMRTLETEDVANFIQNEVYKRVDFIFDNRELIAPLLKYIEGAVEDENGFVEPEDMMFDGDAVSTKFRKKLLLPGHESLSRDEYTNAQLRMYGMLRGLRK